MSSITPGRRATHRSRMAQSASPSMRSRKHFVDESLTASPAMSVATSSVVTSQNRFIAPRTVTPTSALAASSWEDFDEGVYAAAQRRKRNQLANSQSSSSISSYGGGHGSSNNSIDRSFTSSYHVVEEDEEMPMDEMMSIRKTVPSPSNSMTSLSLSGRTPQAQQHHHHHHQQQQRRLSNKSTSSVSSANQNNHHHNNNNNNNYEDGHSYQESGVNRIVSVLKQASADSTTHISRPGNLTPEERVLWDAIQGQLASAVKTERMIVEQSVERQLSSKYSARENDLAQQVSELQQQLVENMHNSSNNNNSSSSASVSDDRGSGASSSNSSSSSSSSSSTKLKKRLKQMESQLRKSQEALKERESEHDSEVRAIQRVLAEITTDREKETEELTEKVKSLEAKVKSLEEENKTLSKNAADAKAAAAAASSSAQGSAPSGDAVEEISKLKEALQAATEDSTASKREADKKTRRLITAERDYKVARAQLHKSDEEKKKLKAELQPLKQRIESQFNEIADLKLRNLKLDEDLETKSKQLLPRSNVSTPTRDSTPPRPGSASDTESVSSVEVENLQKNLDETSSSLENAKKIIASLENANGSLALDLRAKLKAKEEELGIVQNESSERKRRLDSLATELRDLQRKQGDVDRAQRHTKAQLMRQKALTVHLEKSLSGLQSASVVHEVSTATGAPDTANIDHVSEILGDTLVALRTTLDMAEQNVDEHDDMSVAFTEADCSSEVGRHIDQLIRHDREAAAKDLRHELDQKKNAVRRLEDALKKQNEEMKRLRVTVEKRGTESNDKLKAEIQSLRDQCATNMEVLATKERELSVLRSTLKLDDNDAGYISDDASDDNDDDDDDDGNTTTTITAPGLNGYGAAQTAALASMFAQSGSPNMSLSRKSQEVESLKNELMKALNEKEKAAKDAQTERESLANAKMIISSLEQANKSMMEDLRSRLQDSNTAISSLLDKSMEHEKASSALKEEVEKLKREKEALELDHKSELQKLKDESKVSTLRIASKERELKEMRMGQEKSGFEEKKLETEESD